MLFTRPIPLLALLIIASCTSSYHIQTMGNLQKNLDPKQRVLITVPDDGTYEQIHYHGSGTMVSLLIKRAISRHTNHVDIRGGFHTLDTALAYARHNQYGYLVYPVILHWEDRATEWSGIPDQVSIRILVHDVRNNVDHSDTLIEGKSGLATFGGDHPQDLLRKPIDEYFSKLYPSNTHRSVMFSPTRPSPSAHSRILIRVPDNGQYGNIRYAGSGLLVAKMLSLRVQHYNHNVTIGENDPSVAAALERAHTEHYDFLLYPEILHWEDRATGISNIPDRVTVKLMLFAVEDPTRVAIFYIDENNAADDCNSDHPYELLQKPFTQFVSAVFDARQSALPASVDPCIE